MSLAVPALDADAANITAGDYVDVVESGSTGALYVAQRVLVLSAWSRRFFIVASGGRR